MRNSLHCATPTRSLVSLPVRKFDPWAAIQSLPFSAWKLPRGTVVAELVTPGRSVSIALEAVGQPAAMSGFAATTNSAMQPSADEITELRDFETEVFGIPGLSSGRDSDERTSARILPGPKVSFASISKWGNEPEGWYVDLPAAVFMIGVNYSPLELPEIIVTPGFCQSRKKRIQLMRLAWPT